MSPGNIVNKIVNLVSDGDKPKKKHVEALKKAHKKLTEKRKSLKKRIADADSGKKLKKLKTKLTTNRMHREKAVALLRQLTNKRAG